MWSINCCISLSAYRRSVCQTKFNRNSHCTKIARSCWVRRSIACQMLDACLNLLSEYEKLAVRLLQCLYLSNPTMARLALKRENFEFNKLSSLEVASMWEVVLGRWMHGKNDLVMSHSEDFVGHTSVQEVFDVIWSGETMQKVNRWKNEWIRVETDCLD